MMELMASEAMIPIGFLNLLSEGTEDYYLFYDCKTGIVSFSDNIKEAFDIFPDGKACCTLTEWRSLVDPRDLPRLEEAFEDLYAGKKLSYNVSYRVRRRDGRNIWINSRGKCHVGTDGNLDYVLGRVSDGGFSDKDVPLGKAFGTGALKRELSWRIKNSKSGYLLLVGVDNLKTINLQFGREFGDMVIRSLAAEMGSDIFGAPQPFRVNGDCFAVVIPDVCGSQVEDMFHQLQRKIGEQYTVSGGGVSVTKYQVPDEGTLLQYAESALEASKANGKNRLSFFSPADYEKRLGALELREDLEASVKANFAGFSLCYQVQVRSESYELYGAEALLRYHSPRRGDVPSAEFIPILEDSGLIYPVGLWVVRQALEQCARWRKVWPQFHISVNMSYRQLAINTVQADVLAAVKASGLPGSALTIEVTESMQLLDYPQINNIFRVWKGQGIEISVDDFGTGYSSLGRLKEMEVDEIKIDRCFIRDIQKSAYNYRLVSNMLELADSCQIRVCCEGVETEGELAVLEDLHPALYQGFFFGTPWLPESFACHCGTWTDKIAKMRGSHLPSDRADMSLVRQADGETENEIAKTILEAENDIFYLSDMDTYELYYLNPAGQRMFGVRDYEGRKCYKVLHGVDEPCSFCTNSHLRQDSFYVWENQNSYCGRHFLLKDKVVNYRGKKVRLEVALDITKQEYVSQATQERLAFADKIVGYMETLSTHTDYREAVNQVLASVGEFYQADRAYLFERSLQMGEYWDNTFEWCAPGVAPQKDSLQKVSSVELRRWLNVFEENKSIVIFNLAPLREYSPLEWKALSRQEIQRLIAVPVRENNRTVGFIGVDNPRYAIHDDSQMRVLASFLVTRIRQDRNEQRYQALLQESNQDILEAMGVGFWTISLSQNGRLQEMIANDTMYRMLGVATIPSPEGFYRFWHDRVRRDAVDRVDQAMGQMCRTHQVVQVEFGWMHPAGREVKLRFSGLQIIEEAAGRLHLKGYCRLLDPPSVEDIY